MKPPYRDYGDYVPDALIMVRRNCGRKGWKTLIRHAGPSTMMRRTIRVPMHRAARACPEQTQPMH
ncbi:hypothetical protein [Burkholderia sp. Nafp2/4-1b]|uniref:hypothetical protein n=1 Tax=Burkholderia sp. Nafp2/4-1b TaxID=2116686 RepID=UPI0013CE4C74|nr:hypothetical protein [Burkholderia sp. Nafp2/4-1b]